MPPHIAERPSNGSLSVHVRGQDNFRERFSGEADKLICSIAAGCGCLLIVRLHLAGGTSRPLILSSRVTTHPREYPCLAA